MKQVPLGELSLQELVKMASLEVLQSLLKGTLADGVSSAVQLALNWKDQKEGFNKGIVFEAEARKVAGQRGMVSAWTDGLSVDQPARGARKGITSDGDELCAFKLTPGKKYRVTIEELP